VISQQNPSLLSALSLLTTSHVTVLSSLYLTQLLTWSQLPTLLKLNSERLTASYRLLAAFLTKHGIDFVAPSHGLFLWAKMAKKAQSVGDEQVFFEELGSCGVKVGEGRFYKGVEGDYGWARIRFSMNEGLMTEALGKMDGVLMRRKG
jgi:DNA-binding transcriptional MocR family regulator